MKLDRGLQLEILNLLADHYPEQCALPGEGPDGEATTVNAWYLEEHGLIECAKVECIDEPPAVIGATITARGLDFLADDGGLSAILGVVTISLHDETLKALISQKIEKSSLPPADKGIWLEALRRLPAETTKHLAVKLMDLGLAHSPDALAWVGTLLNIPQ